MKIAGNGGLNPIQGGNDGCFTGVALFLVLVQVYLPIKIVFIVFQRKQPSNFPNHAQQNLLAKWIASTMRNCYIRFTNARF